MDLRVDLMLNLLSLDGCALVSCGIRSWLESHSSSDRDTSVELWQRGMCFFRSRRRDAEDAALVEKRRPFVDESVLYLVDISFILISVVCLCDFPGFSLFWFLIILYIDCYYYKMPCNWLLLLKKFIERKRIKKIWELSLKSLQRLLWKE